LSWPVIWSVDKKFPQRVRGSLHCLHGRAD
jgi:hypothetical protein